MIRFAEEKDSDQLINLLNQVNTVHVNGRPDLFKKNAEKYTKEDIVGFIKSENTKIFCYVDNDHVLGYAFCEIVYPNPKNNHMVPMKRFHIDDICVDENHRRKQIGTSLYEHAKSYANEIGCKQIYLTVWELNGEAKKFYEKIGMKPLNTVMEEMLK